jgi:hypothetical protein
MRASRQISFVDQLGGAPKANPAKGRPRGRPGSNSEWKVVADDGVTKTYQHIQHVNWTLAIDNTVSDDARRQRLRVYKAKQEASNRGSHEEDPAPKRAKSTPSQSNAEAKTRVHLKQAAARGESVVSDCCSTGHFPPHAATLI